ncbi:MAG: hypothetical protein EA357_10855 [Micavibrio sp.]|nr:MAG: hypothetical protein EA357_10855 [Micavibrio sp.]
MGKRADKLRELSKKAPKKKREPLLKFWGRIFKKILMIFLFTVYLVVGLVSTSIWAKAAVFRALDTNQMLGRLDHYRHTSKYFDAVFMFDIQKTERAKEIIEFLEDIAHEIEPVFYFQIAKRYEELGMMEDAVFWHLLGSYRMRFDAQRCEGLPDFQGVEYYVRFYTTPKLAIFMAQDIDRMERVFNRVMDWDYENPPQTLPVYYCRLARQFLYRHIPEFTGFPIPQDQWQDLYTAYRIYVMSTFIPSLRGQEVEPASILRMVEEGIFRLEEEMPLDENVETPEAELEDTPREEDMP